MCETVSIRDLFTKKSDKYHRWIKVIALCSEGDFIVKLSLYYNPNSLISWAQKCASDFFEDFDVFTAVSFYVAAKDEDVNGARVYAVAALAKFFLDNPTIVTEEICGSKKIDLVSVSKNTMLFRGLIDISKEFVSKLSEEDKRKSCGEVADSIIELLIWYFTDVSQFLVKDNMDLSTKIEEYQNKCRSLTKEFDNMKSKTESLQSELNELTKNSYDEITTLTKQNELMREKLFIYEQSITSEEFVHLKEVANDTLNSVDVSKYKILIVGSKNQSEQYPFDYIDVDAKPKSVLKINRADIILFDTASNSHHTYWSVKQTCKNLGIPMFHINNRNKDKIIEDTKRLIAKRV